MKKLLLAAFLALLPSAAALAQSSPGLITGQTPTAAQWNSYFSAKQDVLPSATTPGTVGSSTTIPTVTVNAKGIVVSTSSNPVIAPAGTLSGATLAPNILASSLTSVGTLTGGATGPGFTLALSSSTLTGLLPIANGGCNATTAASCLANIGGVPLAGGTMTGPLTLPGNPTLALQAVPKQYVDALSSGLQPKASVATATTANITLSGEQTIDGVLTSASRVLVKNQTAAAENGIYVSAAGAWARSSDLNTWTASLGALVFVSGGTVNAGSSWVAPTAGGGTIGVTAMPWSQFAGTASYSAGAGLTLTGSQFSIAGSAITNSMLNANVFSSTHTWSASQTLSAPLFLSGTTPNLLMTPSSGATKSGSIFQSADVLGFGASGVAIYGQFNLNTGTFSLTPTPASLAQGINITQTGPTSGGATGTSYDFNYVVVSEAMNLTNTSTIASAFHVEQYTGGSNASGARSAFRSTMNLISPTSPTSVQRDYSGGTFIAIASSGDNGTNTGAGALGNIYAINPIVVAASGATNLAQVTGGETDVSLLTGSSVQNAYGMSYERGGDLQGTGVDSVLHVGAGAGAVWKDFLYIRAIGNGNLAVSNAIIEIDGSGPPATLAKGIDLTGGGNVTISGNSWVSPGAQITGTGAAVMTSYWVAGVGAGVDCTVGTLNPTTATVNRGIVTHC